MNVAIAAMIAGRLRRRRRDHAVTRIHDKMPKLLEFLLPEELELQIVLESIESVSVQSLSVVSRLS